MLSWLCFTACKTLLTGDMAAKEMTLPVPSSFSSFPLGLSALALSTDFVCRLGFRLERLEKGEDDDLLAAAVLLPALLMRDE